MVMVSLFYVIRQSAGACVIAGGLLEVAKHVSELEKRMYWDAAIKILRAISEKRADYYFIEAVYKVKGIGKLLW